MMNVIPSKKGASVTGIMELSIIIFVILFLFSSATFSMNNKYNQTYTTPFGNGSEQISQMEGYSKNVQNSTQVQFTIFGIQLSSFALVTGVLSIIYNTILGGWIPQVAPYALHNWDGAAALGMVLQTLWICLLGFAIVSLLMKRRP